MTISVGRSAIRSPSIASLAPTTSKKMRAVPMSTNNRASCAAASLSASHAGEERANGGGEFVGAIEVDRVAAVEVNHANAGDGARGVVAQRLEAPLAPAVDQERRRRDLGQARRHAK